MSQYNPKVSIIIPVYNGANFLREAIETALAQTYKNIEIIVINDGSNDNGATEKIAQEYSNQIKYYLKENGGVSSALNYGIKMMDGDYFAWLSHDDLYTPERIEHAVDVLKSNDSIKEELIVYSDGVFVKEDRSVIKSFKKYFEKETIYSGVEAAVVSAQKGTLYGCSLLIPRSAFQKVGLFDENLRYSQDSLMWYLLFMNGYHICLCPHKDVLARLHRNQVTNTRKDLFVHDSLIIADILAPLFEKSSKELLYTYIRRLTRLNCDETVMFLIDYTKHRKVLNKIQISTLNMERIYGKVIYRRKTFVKKIILR